jgi:hypothetical protein
MQSLQYSYGYSDVPPNGVSRLAWLQGKTHKQHGLSRKNAPSNAPEHAAANLFNFSMAASDCASIEDQPKQLLLAAGK